MDNNIPCRLIRLFNSHGFTLLEVLISLAILIIIFSIAQPSFSSMYQKSQAQLTVSKLKSALSKARQTAIHSKQNVILCSAQEQLECDNSALWQQQILVFIDSDKNSRFNPSSKDQLITRFAILANENSQLKTSYHPKIRFNNKGMTSNPSRFTYCIEGQESSLSYSFTLSMSGRISKTETADDC